MRSRVEILHANNTLLISSFLISRHKKWQWSQWQTIDENSPVFGSGELKSNRILCVGSLILSTGITWVVYFCTWFLCFIHHISQSHPIGRQDASISTKQWEAHAVWCSVLSSNSKFIKYSMKFVLCCHLLLIVNNRCLFREAYWNFW